MRVSSRVKGKLVNTLMEMRVRSEGARLFEALEAAAQDVEQTQFEVLKRILEDHKETYFGKIHKFNMIESLADFRKFVPVHDYETLRSWMDSQDLTGRPTINPDLPSFYAMTSGTTGKPKFIPVLKTSLRSHKHTTNLFIYRVMKDRPDVLKGHILAIVSPAIEGYRPDSGASYGSTSGHMYQGMPKLVRKKYIVPPAVFSIEDYDLKYQLILRLALRYRDVSYLSTANPSTIVRLVKLLNSNWPQLYKDLREGGFSRMDELTNDQRRSLVGRLGAKRVWAEELNTLYQKNGKLRIQDVFPTLQAVGCWTGGSCAIFFEQLKSEFPPQTLVRDIGYLSSEFRGTVPISSHTNAGVPTFRDYFFEFVEKNNWEADRQEFIGLGQLQDKKQYYIFVTTDSGLYRYNMNDIVEVDGFFHKAPLLRFVQKGKGVTNITGEKLYESQVIYSLQRAENTLGLSSSFYTMICDPERAVYRLVYEPKIETVEKTVALKEEIVSNIETALNEVNIEYEVKRKSARLLPLELMVLKPGTFEEFKKFCLKQGQRESQFKIIALQYKKDIKFNFANHALVDIATLPSDEVPAQVTEAQKAAEADQGPRMAV